MRKHGTVFKAVAALVQLAIQTDSPLFKISSKANNDSIDILKFKKREEERKAQEEQED